jgi:PAS domain S-box-containing protein
LAEAARADGPVLSEDCYQAAGGEVRTADAAVTAVRGPDGAVRFFVIQAADTTERRGAEAALREREARFRDALEIGTIGVIFFDPEGRITDANDAFLQMTGFSREDLAAGLLRWDDITPPEWRPAFLRAVEELKTAGSTTPHEKECLRKDGSRYWALFAAKALGDGRAVEFILDITEAKRAEAALRESERRFRTLAEGIPQLVFRSRGSGERTWGSPQWNAYAGMSEEESLGLGWLDAVHPDDRAATMAAWAEAEARGMFAVEHRTRRAADGAFRWFQSRAVPVRDEEGRIVEWLGTSTDIEDQVRAREVLARGRDELEALVAERTIDLAHALDSLRTEVAERGRAEEALRQAQKMEAVGQLTGGMAHDFNNMLQGVAGGLEMARRRIAEGRTEQVVRYLDMAREAVGRTAGLTRRLLAFARRQRLDPKPVDADGLIAGMAELVRRTVGPGVRVELKLRDGAGSVLCDPNELESALLNLCINARDAMPEGGRLTIGTEDAPFSAADNTGREGSSAGGYTVISVADTGAGMPPEVLERVFEPFFTTKPQGQGTGLGLSQVYGFVRQSGGLVRLESAPGQGTTVRLFLPKHEGVEAAEERAAPAVADRAGGGETVLLVDDEAAVRGPAAERLRELGYRVLEAADGPEALRVLQGSRRPDLLVTDVGLPNGMNGRQVAEAVRERAPGLPVLFITGYAGTALQSGFEVIGKPFELDALARQVRALLAAGRNGPAEGAALQAPEAVSSRQDRAPPDMQA